MGHLRLLYCDSAGVRRCRVLVCDGDLPSAAGLAAVAAGGPASTQAPPAGAGNSLEFTPSIALAAAAGCIPAPAGPRPSLQTSKSLGRVAEDRVLSPEASEEDRQLYLQQQQQQSASEPAADKQQQQEQQQQPVSGTATPTLPKLGSFSTAPGLRPSPSMILAAAAGAIAVPEGAHIPRFASNNSLDELAGVSAVPDYNQTPPQLLNQHSYAAPGTPAAGGSSLSPTPSMALAAAAGAIVLTPGSNNSSRHQSPSRLGHGASAAAMLGSPMQPAAAQQSRLAPAKPPLISAFLRGPLGFAAPAGLGTAAAAAAVSAAANLSVALTKACMGQPAYTDLVVESSGLAPVGEVLLVPDLSAAVPWGLQPGDIMAPVDMLEKDLSQPWSCCPRAALKRALSALESHFGLTLMAGFELEFVLLKPAPLEVFKVFPEAAASTHVLLSGGQAWVPLDSTIYCQASAMSAGTTAVLQEIVANLQSIGINTMQYHAEAAPGQFEVALTPFPALQAADKLLLAREVMTHVVARHGLAVTWLPKPFAGEAGSGCHVHFSLWRGGDSVMADAAAAVAGGAAQLPSGSYPLTATANSFLSGVLDHLPALLPFTAPSTNSYNRLKPGCWSGAYVCWGYENREAPLRVCCPRGGPQATNAEFKAFDGSTNPYIGLAALVAAGMQGLEEGSRLPAVMQLDPGTSGNAGIASQLQLLPSSLPDALQCWSNDKKLQVAVQGVLGADLTKAFIAVRQCEAEANPRLEALLLRY